MCPSKLLLVQIRNVAFQKTCLDSPTRKSDHHKPVGLYPCHRQGGNQVFCRLQYDLMRQYHFVGVFVQTVLCSNLFSYQSALFRQHSQFKHLFLRHMHKISLFLIVITNARYEIKRSEVDSASMGSLKKIAKKMYRFTFTNATKVVADRLG